MSKLYYAFHYDDGLNTTYASNPKKAAGSVFAYASKKLRDESCNTFQHSFMDFNKKQKAIRAVTVKQIGSIGHADALDSGANEGAHVQAHVVGIDI